MHPALVVAASSDPSSGTKTLVVGIAIAATAVLFFVIDRLARRDVERKVRGYIRDDHPEAFAFGEPDEWQLPRDSRPRSVRWREHLARSKEVPPPKIAADRRVLAALIALVVLFVGALVMQAATDSSVAGWVAFVGFFVVVVSGYAALLR